MMMDDDETWERVWLRQFENTNHSRSTEYCKNERNLEKIKES